MSVSVEAALAKYWTWLKDRTILRQLEDWTEITTPYLDRHNDFIQIYVKPDNDGFLLTDDGYTISDLEHSGCKISSPKRLALLALTLNGFGVQQENDALIVKSTEKDFPQRKHNLLQAMLAINDLFYTASPYTASLFLEDVISWLEEEEVRYTPRVKFSGQTGFDHYFDLVIPKSSSAPERIIKAIGKPSKSTIENVAFAWMDTKASRDTSSTAYALLNDSETSVDRTWEDALNNYEIVPVVWSRKADHLGDLAA